MTRKEDSMPRLSNALSDVLDNIGVNETLIKARRYESTLKAALKPLFYSQSMKVRSYEFGSQSEGSTTPGLNSDSDALFCLYEVNVILDPSEHRSESSSLLVIQPEYIAPSYCHLHLINSGDCSDHLFLWSDHVDVLPHCVTDSKGRLLLKNTSLTHILYNPKFLSERVKCRMHGPALTSSLGQYADIDIVYCFYSDTLPSQVSTWLQQRKECGWPTEDVLDDCRKAGVFLVPADSKLSASPELEWRISTHLQERYLMFSLNIAQLRCYILMKIILKIYINLQIEDVLSSYMCKNIVFYCVSESPHDWHAGNLLSKVKTCLVRLQKCVEHVKCPHFIVPENNLMAGRISETQRIPLLEIIDEMVKNITTYILGIMLDSIGDRMRRKLYGISYSDLNIEPAESISQNILFNRIINTAFTQKLVLCMILDEIEVNSVQTTALQLTHKLQKFQSFKLCRRSDIEQVFPHTDTKTIRAACNLLIPLVSSTLGSLLASINIARNKPVSDEAFSYLTEGKDSDVLSGRLKLVSVLFCSGDMKRTEDELDTALEHYRNNRPIISICDCYFLPGVGEFRPTMQHFSGNKTKSSVALCVTFLRHEINCVPNEIRYEILRSYIEKDKQKWTAEDREWMDYIVVDPIPFLHYLQYKTYERLDRSGEKLKALQSVADDIVQKPNLSHRETALNLLGQCCENEQMQAIALQCYISSIKHRKINNAARLLLCLQLFKLMNQYQY